MLLLPARAPTARARTVTRDQYATDTSAVDRRTRVVLLLPLTIAVVAGVVYYAAVEATAGAGCGPDAHFGLVPWFIAIVGMSVAAYVAATRLLRVQLRWVVTGAIITLFLCLPGMAFAFLSVGANHGCWS